MVELADSAVDWTALYRSFADEVSAACADLGVEVAHVGSTSVPGLVAKPLIDIAIGAALPINERDFVTRLAPCGFDFVADLGHYGGLFFTSSTDDGIVVAHLHVVDLDDFQWRWYIAFRDALRSDPELRQEYTELKQQAALAYPDDRDAYTRAKSDWLLETVSRIADG